MNYPKILLLACLIISSAALGCQKDEPAFETKTFEATFYTDLDSLVPDSVACEGDENLLNTQKGSGSEPTVGSFNTTMAFCFNTNTFEYGNTEASFVAEDGDELFLDVSGQVVPTTEPGYDLEFKDPFTIIGGTGRFEGATGSGATESYVNMTTSRTDPDGWSDAAMDTSNLEIIYNDDVFNAAIISFGRFGVIYSLVYEVIPAYYVLERRDKYHWPTIKDIVLNNTAQGLFNTFRWSNQGLPQDYYNTESRTFKIDMSLGTFREGDDSSSSACYLTRRAETTPDGGPVVPPDKFIMSSKFPFEEVWHDIILDPDNLGLLSEIGFQNPDDFFNVLSDAFHGRNDRLASLLNEVSNEPRRRFTEFLFGEMVEPHPSGYAYGPSWFIDGVTGPPQPLPPGDSLEYMFDANHPSVYLELVDYVLEEAKSPHQMAGWLSLRYSKGTHALLGMHQYENTVAVEISFLKDITGNQEFLDLVRQKARELGGIPHWGQMHDFRNRRELEGYYGNKLHTWLKALSRLSRYGNASTFENEFTANLGLRPTRVDNLLFMGSG